MVFMGDIGALALGAALGTVAVIVRQELVLVIMGGIFVMETVSVILQVASFKLTGKRRPSIPHGADPSPLRAEGLAGAARHRALLDHHGHHRRARPTPELPCCRGRTRDCRRARRRRGCHRRHRADYRDAKARILARAEQVVLNDDDAVTRQLAGGGARTLFTLAAPAAAQYGVEIDAGEEYLVGPHGTRLAASALGLVGRHNIANALAAIAVCHAFGARGKVLLTSLASFGGLDHRAQLVATIAGVRYINDSKATNSGAACATIRGLCRERGGVLIAGGEAKEPDFTEFADTVVAHMHTVVLIGRAAPLFAAAMHGRIATVFATDMRGAVAAAAAAAQPGDMVLLSPACASFDMFANYAARGFAFRDAVLERMAP
jgi:hypothetical protein